jgi:shikimate dehydrogenase
MSRMPTPATTDQVSFLNGRTRLYGIVGDPIEQVRSPEMITWELQQRGCNAVLLPLHVREPDFDAVLPHLQRLANLDGLVFTIPFKARALGLASRLGPQAQQVGAVNALKRSHAGDWVGEMFDGAGCVEAFRRRGLPLAGQRMMLIGLGGAGSAIAAAVAAQQPARLRLHDLDAARCERVAGVVRRISPHTQVEVGAPTVDAMDVLLNASPVGMLGDPRRPITDDSLPDALVVFDAIVKPEVTPLLALAQRCGCRTVQGREMMRGQIARMVDFFLEAD